MKTAALALALLLTASSANGAAPERTAIRRFALIVGMNDGGKKRVELRYATDDARRMASVLEDLGGLSDADRTVLLSADRAQLTSALELMRARIAAAKRPGTLRQLIFYYSGHSDGEGLLLGNEHVKYGDLRKMLQDVGADIQIAILDSCASGALVRSKGGRTRPPFLLDESNKVRGHVFLTSSSENEVAQESDRIGGSFFTHYLISGLRGAADTSHDGKVTLSEAYQFAFDETLKRTEQTTGGAQHASYDMQLAGSGDLVITDLRESAARLTFGADLDGRFYVRDTSGRLVAELYKARGRPAELGLEPGRYQITQEVEGALRVATIVVERGETPSLAELTPVEGEQAIARGDSDEEAPYYPIGVSLIPQLSTSFSRRITTNFALDVLWGAYANVRGAQISSLVGQVDKDLHGVQIAGIVGITGDTVVGAQISGVVNWAGTVEGAQIGVVNVAGDGRGVQIGVVNVAEHFEGLRLGLFNISKDTIYRPSAWTGETSPLEVGFKMQDGSVYTLVTAGARSFTSAGPWTFGYGLGGEIAFGRFFVDIDATAMSVHLNHGFANAKLLPVRLRVTAGVRILPRIAIFGGVAGTVAIDFDQPAGLDLYAPKWAKRVSNDIAIWPGFVLGLEI